MSQENRTLSKEDIAAIGTEIERRIVDPLKRRMAWEGKKVESHIKGLSFALEKSLVDIGQSLEILAREFARRGKDTSDS